jgi:hypothetical protein
MIGGLSLIAAAVAVRFVSDTDEHAYSSEVAREPLFTAATSAQPVPSEGLTGA